MTGYNIKAMVYILCFIAGSFGCMLNVICGFGVGVFSMMFLPYVMESTFAAAAMINIITVFQASWICWRWRKKVQWKQMIVPLCGYFVLATVTSHYAMSLSNDTLKILLGLFLVVLSVYFLFIAKRIRIQATVPNGLLAGSIGGVMSALFSVGGPPMSLYYSSVFDDKEQYWATLQSYFLVTTTYIVGVRIQSGVVTSSVLICSAVAIAGMILGTYIGKRIFDKINADTMRKFIYIMMAVSGIVMLLES